MITRAWVQAEIEQALKGQNTRENVYDLAMLIIVLHYLDDQSAAPVVTYANAATPESDDERKKREAIILTSYSANLDTKPTISQIYDALDAVEVPDIETQKKVRDAETWASILAREW